MSSLQVEVSPCCSRNKGTKSHANKTANNPAVMDGLGGKRGMPHQQSSTSPIFSLRVCSMSSSLIIEDVVL